MTMMSACVRACPERKPQLVQGVAACKILERSLNRHRSPPLVLIEISSLPLSLLYLDVHWCTTVQIQMHFWPGEPRQSLTLSSKHTLTSSHQHNLRTVLENTNQSPDKKHHLVGLAAASRVLERSKSLHVVPEDGLKLQRRVLIQHLPVLGAEAGSRVVVGVLALYWCVRVRARPSVLECA